jgi:hypothetical protein
MTDFKRTPESSGRAAEIARKIRSGEIQVTYARSTRINDLRKWVGQVLEALGHPEAFVTDLSTLGVFGSAASGGASQEAQLRLGFRVEPSDRVVDVRGSSGSRSCNECL